MIVIICGLCSVCVLLECLVVLNYLICTSVCCLSVSVYLATWWFVSLLAYLPTVFSLLVLYFLCISHLSVSCGVAHNISSYFRYVFCLYISGHTCFLNRLPCYWSHLIILCTVYWLRRIIVKEYCGETQRSARRPAESVLATKQNCTDYYTRGKRDCHYDFGAVRKDGSLFWQRKFYYFEFTFGG